MCTACTVLAWVSYLEHQYKHGPFGNKLLISSRRRGGHARLQHVVRLAAGNSNTGIQPSKPQRALHMHATTHAHAIHACLQSHRSAEAEPSALSEHTPSPLIATHGLNAPLCQPQAGVQGAAGGGEGCESLREDVGFMKKGSKPAGCFILISVGPYENK